MCWPLTRLQETCLIADVSRVSCQWDGIALHGERENVMSVEEVKKTLADEVKLLEHMIAAVKDFDGSKSTKQAQFIQDSWARFLDDRRRTNVSLAQAGDDEVVEDLSQEMQQVEQYIKATDPAAGYTETWEKFLTCERDILKYLVDMGRNGKSAP